MAAATVAHTTARIADAADALARGVVSHANAIGRGLGVAPGMRCAEAARRCATRRGRDAVRPRLPREDAR